MTRDSQRNSGRQRLRHWQLWLTIACALLVISGRAAPGATSGGASATVGEITPQSAFPPAPSERDGARFPPSLRLPEGRSGIIFKLGSWDGGSGRLPTSATMSQEGVPAEGPRAPGAFRVGFDPPNIFPALELAGRNSPVTLQFFLAPNQIVDLSFRLGLARSFGGATPAVLINGRRVRALPDTEPAGSRGRREPAGGPPRQIEIFPIPGASLRYGTNTLEIRVEGRAGTSRSDGGVGWVYQALELDGPVASPSLTAVEGNPLAVCGVAGPFQRIQLWLDDATPSGEGVSSATGEFRVEYQGAPLSVGLHHFTATAADADGHVGIPSAPIFHRRVRGR